MHIPLRRSAARFRVSRAGVLLLMMMALAPSAARAQAADSLAAPPPAPPPAEVRQVQTGLTRPDRLNHMSLSLAAGVGAGMLARSPAVGAGTALGIGLAKEVFDDHFDRGDLFADAVGAALAAVVVAALIR
jgi:hypothetical protein